ncbi:hypothetical protein ACFL49_01345 [Candidatus Omnitrophota bacterium]
MDIDKYWQKALKNTEIVRSRIRSLNAACDTVVPYILLCESELSSSDTVVRKGEVVVSQPSLIIPPNNPQFEGFEFDEDQGIEDNSLINYLLVRGISLPSLRYDNKTCSLDIYEDKLSSALKFYKNQLQQEENVDAGLIIGSQDSWQFSLLIFICSQIARNVDADIRRMLNEHQKKQKND